MDINKMSESINNRELHTAHGAEGTEAFRAGGEVREKYLQEIEKISNQGIKADAISRVAKLYYEIDEDLEEALKWAGKIEIPNFRIHCIIQIAVMILNKEKDIDKADKLIEKISEKDKDEFGSYIDSYQKIRKEIASKK